MKWTKDETKWSAMNIVSVNLSTDNKIKMDAENSDKKITAKQTNEQKILAHFGSQFYPFDVSLTFDLGWQ